MHGGKLKPGVRPAFWKRHQNYPSRAEPRLADVADPRAGVEMVQRRKEDDIVGKRHGVHEEAAKL